MATAQFIAILDALGGPKLTSEDVEWVTDLPAGRDLLNFFVSQVGEGEVALKDIALETEEVNIWRKAVEAGLVVVDPPSFTASSHTELAHTPSDYVPPSLLRSRLRSIEEEQMLLDAELQRLTQRIARTRATTKRMTYTQKLLSSAKEQVSTSISSLEGSLSDLSQKADSTISAATRSACQLIDRHSLGGSKDGESIQKWAHEMDQSLGVFFNILDDLTRLAEFKRDPSDPLATENMQSMKHEVQRLAVSIKELEDTYLARELERICIALQEGASPDSLLANSDQIPTSTSSTDEHWVEKTFTQAWNTEQAKDLHHRTTNLKKISKLLEDELLPPLLLMHASLNMSDGAGEETLVITQALIDELNDIQADLVPSADEHEVYTPPRDMLTEDIKTLLKRLRDLRPENLPPLMLMEHKDVLNELSDVRSRHAAVHAEITSLASATSSIPTNSPALLSALLSHSPLPSNPPISLPLPIQKELSTAKTHVAKASNILSTLPNEIPKDNRMHRRLDGFIQSNRVD